MSKEFHRLLREFYSYLTPSSSPKYVGYGNTKQCRYSRDAKALLEKHGHVYIDMTGKFNYVEAGHQKIVEKSPTIPVVFANNKHIGGFDELDELMKKESESKKK